VAEHHQPNTRSCPDQLPVPPDTILRFLKTERLLHWAIAIPFLGCFATALVLVVVYNPVLVAVYNPDPMRVYRPTFAWIHRVCAAGLIVCPSFVLLASLRRLRIHFYNIRQAWLWTFDDIKWLFMMGPAALSKRIVLPDQGKFNAAEKLNFMMVMGFSPLLVASGLLIWFPETSRLDTFFPWMIHCGLAALATPLICGHVIMATINPSTRVGLTGMISGYVSREWAAHHYARWFREQFPDLLQGHDGENTHDAEVTAEDEAGADRRRPAAGVDQVPVETARWLRVPEAPAPLRNPVRANGSLGAAIAHASTASSIVCSTLPGAPLTSQQWDARPTTAAAAPQQDTTSCAAEHPLNRPAWTCAFESAAADVVDEIRESGSAIDSAEDVLSQPRDDTEAATDR